MYALLKTIIFMISMVSFPSKKKIIPNEMLKQKEFVWSIPIDIFLNLNYTFFESWENNSGYEIENSLFILR